MSENDSGYDIKPVEQPAPPPATPATEATSAPAGGTGAVPRPGEPGWVPPVPIIEKADAEASDENAADPDVEKNKGMAVLAYVLFLIPLVAAPNSKYARYHANQGLLLFILLISVCLVVALLQVGETLATHLFSGIPILKWFFASCGLPVLQVAFLVGWVALMIIGIINAANGIKKPLPGVGHWELIK